MIRRRNKTHRLTIIGLVLVFGFGIFQFSSSLFRMPLKIANLENGESIESPFFTLEGNAKKAVELLVNDKPVLLQKNGDFDVPMTFAPGYNTFSVEIENRIGKTKEETFAIFVNKDGKIMEGKTTEVEPVLETEPPPDEPASPDQTLEETL